MYLEKRVRKNVFDGAARKDVLGKTCSDARVRPLPVCQAGPETDLFCRNERCRRNGTSVCTDPCCTNVQNKSVWTGRLCGARAREGTGVFGEAEKTYRTGQHKTCAELCSGCSSFVKGSAAETHPRRLRPKRSHPGVCSCTKAGLACILCTRTKLFFSCTPSYFPHASCHVNTFCALLAEQNALLDRGGDPHAGRVLERVCKRQEKSITD